MDITPTVPQGSQLITNYGNGQFKIAGDVYTTSVMIFPDDVMAWGVAPDKTITQESLEPVFEYEGQVDILLIGCTKPQMAIPMGIRSALKEANISLEIMDTGAAVRTYNVLLTEGRRVAAALVLV